MHSLRVAWVFPLIVSLAAITGCSRDRTGGGLGIDPRSFIDAGSATCAEACTNLRRLAEHPSCSDLGFELPPDCEAECEAEMVDGATLACIASAADCGQFIMCVDDGGEDCTCDTTSSCDCSCDPDCDDPPPPPLDAGTGTDSGPGDVDAGGGFLCSDTCELAFNGECDDGGPDATTEFCELGTDCSDCGPRTGGI